MSRSAFRTAFILLPSLALLLLPNPASAQALTASREALESFAKYMAKGGAKVAPSAARATEKLIASHGDDALRAANAVGWKAVGEAVETAGERAPDVVKYMARRGKDSIHVVATPKSTALFLKYGDDAGEALARHKGLAADLIGQGGQPMAKALATLETRGARQMAMLADEPATATLAKDPRLLDVVGRFGDRAMKFVWDNKGALLVGTGLASFAANPEPFLNGAAKLGDEGIKSVGEKAVDKGGEVAKELARVFPWNTALLLGAGLAVPFLGIRLMRSLRSGAAG
jgi:hypothetical protein